MDEKREPKIHVWDNFSVLFPLPMLQLYVNLIVMVYLKLDNIHQVNLVIIFYSRKRCFLIEAHVFVNSSKRKSVVFHFITSFSIHVHNLEHYWDLHGRTNQIQCWRDWQPKMGRKIPEGHSTISKFYEIHSNQYMRCS